MIIFLQLKEQLKNLHELLGRVDADQFTHPSRYLSNATIGGHSRHIIEILQCVYNGYESGEIDYVNRKRNLEIESNKLVAVLELDQLRQQADLSDKPLSIACEDGSRASSTFYREIVYNIDHIIHHLALIKVSLLEMDIEVADHNLGVAYSTIQYRSSQEKGNSQ